MKTRQELRDSCDYEYLDECEVGVYDRSSPEAVGPCGEPAMARIWWEDYDNALLVCQEHFNEIMQF